MPQITLLQDLVASLDRYLPWLLPTLEAIEGTVPVTVRLVICVPLLIWLALLRHRQAASDRPHRVAL